MTSYFDSADIVATVAALGVLIDAIVAIVPSIIGLMIALAAGFMVVGFFASISGFLGDSLNISKIFRRK